MAPTKVLVVFGGRSGEHEVSVVSARSVFDALRALGHEAVGVGISREGRWCRWDPDASDRVPTDAEPYRLDLDSAALRGFDVAFPVLHGPFGEDGSIQGVFEVAGVPYVGAGVTGSAIATNKIAHKRLFAAAGLNVVRFFHFHRDEWTARPDTVRERIAELGFPSFTKPAHLGSSVGISKVSDPTEIDESVERALRNDDLVLVEEGVSAARELEVGALDLDELRLSVAGEIRPEGEFYDYVSKYRDAGTVLQIPAQIPERVEREIREVAAQAFRLAFCEGFARIDFFWDSDADRLWLNEINSIPGLTPSSMFPKLWEASGKPFPEVVDGLLQHALRRHERKTALEAARLATHTEEVGGSTAARPPL